MTEILLNALACSLAIVFIHSCFKEGNIFGKLRIWVERYVDAYWHKPFITCLYCMAPWWGFIYGIIYLPNIQWNFGVIFLFSVGGLNAIFGALINVLDALTNE